MRQYTQLTQEQRYQISVHTLVWNTDNINCVIRHDVKDDMAPFGKAKMTRLDILSRFASTGVLSQPIQTSKDRTGISVSLLQIPFGQGIEPDILQVL
jgi:hypothetical protein